MKTKLKKEEQKKKTRVIYLVIREKKTKTANYNEQCSNALAYTIQTFLFFFFFNLILSNIDSTL